jgi:hypothetical protein
MPLSGSEDHRMRQIAQAPAVASGHPAFIAKHLRAHLQISGIRSLWLPRNA